MEPINQHQDKNTFYTLSSIDCSAYTEKKAGLTYLSWAHAWKLVKNLYPSTNYKVYESDNGSLYHTDGKTCWVKVSVTIENIEHLEYLPVLDYRNKPIPEETITSFDACKAIQRALTKAIARHGLGLYIYQGEDLPQAGQEPNSPVVTTLNTGTTQNQLLVDISCKMENIDTLDELNQLSKEYKDQRKDPTINMLFTAKKLKLNNK